MLLLSLALVGAILWAFDHFVGADETSAETAAWTPHHHRGEGRAEPQRLWKVPAFHGLTQEGRAIDAAVLEGSVWVADFIYTRCTSACPMLTARMVVLARKLSPSVRLLSFSIDPTYDTPAVLSAYARRWPETVLPWTLVAIDGSTLDQLQNGMRIVVDRNPDDPTDITHSNQIFLIDRDGWVRGVYDSQSDGELSELVADAAAIAGGAAAGSPSSAFDSVRSPELGQKLFAELGCSGCHGDARTAPPLGAFGRRLVSLEDGTSVASDASYLRASILKPGAQVVRGYSTTMPSYEGVLSDLQLDALVGYLASLPPPAQTPAAGAAPDPVCHMQVTVVPGTPQVQHGGQTYYFCSETCRAHFSDHPDRYLGTAASSRDDGRPAGPVKPRPM
jgi:protein SCO1/2